MAYIYNPTLRRPTTPNQANSFLTEGYIVIPSCRMKQHTIETFSPRQCPWGKSARTTYQLHKRIVPLPRATLFLFLHSVKQCGKSAPRSTRHGLPNNIWQRSYFPVDSSQYASNSSWSGRNVVQLGPSKASTRGYRQQKHTPTTITSNSK